MSEVVIRNAQRARRLDTKWLKRVVDCLTGELLELGEFEVGIHLVGARKMTEINEHYLSHAGSTDVITFDHSDEFAPPDGDPADFLYGEIYVCLDEAALMAKDYGTTWQSETVRYVVHGWLHLLGFDDKEPDARKIMKREENRLVKALAKRFDFAELERVES